MPSINDRSKKVLTSTHKVEITPPEPMSNNLLSVGSIAFDTVQTPSRFVEKVLGGSVNYFSISASFFTKTQVVAVVGEDFPEQHLKYLESCGVDTTGIETKKGKTFTWEGEYRGSMQEAITHDTHLNVFEHFEAKLPAPYLNTEYIFLGNISPEIQLNVLSQIQSPRIVAMDTMNFWINNSREKLIEVIKKVDLLIINEEEAKLIGEDKDIMTAVKKLQRLGPKAIAIKQGDNGSISFYEEKYLSTPAVHVEKVVDPTGAGDTFAGGLLGYLAKNNLELNEENLNHASIYGNVMASFAVQDFSFYRLQGLDEEEIELEYKKLCEKLKL